MLCGIRWLRSHGRQLACWLLQAESVCRALGPRRVCIPQASCSARGPSEGLAGGSPVAGEPHPPGPAGPSVAGTTPVCVRTGVLGPDQRGPVWPLCGPGCHLAWTLGPVPCSVSLRFQVQTLHVHTSVLEPACGALLAASPGPKFPTASSPHPRPLFLSSLLLLLPPPLPLLPSSRALPPCHRAACPSAHACSAECDSLPPFWSSLSCTHNLCFQSLEPPVILCFRMGRKSLHP